MSKYIELAYINDKYFGRAKLTSEGILILKFNSEDNKYYLIDIIDNLDEYLDEFLKIKS